MSNALRIYLVLLLAVVSAWFWTRFDDINDFAQDTHWMGMVVISTIYLGSHILRMIRLALLTLNDRSKTFPLIVAHTLTAFPSSFLPFKLGEIFRLGAFFYVYDGRQRAFSVWLAERFADVLVITIFIFGLYLFNISVPSTMRTVFLIFVLVSVFGLVTMFSAAKLSVYLNRHLVLTSVTSRGLAILRICHELRRLETAVYHTVEGRISAFLLLSALIWTFEILALSLFMNHLFSNEKDFASLFASGLVASLPGGGTNSYAFGIYQSLALVALTIVFLISAWLSVFFKRLRVDNV